MALLSLLQDGAVIHPLVLLPVFSLVLAIGYLLFDVVYNLFFNPLRRFPGPKLWAISNIPYTRMFLSGKGHYKMRQLHQEYGPIVRIGPKDLSINHPDGMKDLRGHRKTGTGENSKDPVLAQFNADNIIGANRQDHQRFRRVVAHGFSHQSMVNQEPIIAGYVDKFINGLHEVCTNGTEPLDIAAWFNFATFDIIGDLAFGEPFGCLDNKELHPWISVVEQAHHVSDAKKPKQQLGGAQGYVAREGASGNEMPFEELASNAQVIILAGSETTATLLTATTYFLTTNPETLKKLSDEVRSSFKSESEIDMASVQRLPYMLAVLNEGLRLFPPVINGIQRKVREGGDTIINQYIPGGASVDIWQWAVYHNPDHFALPDEYIPERWLDDPRFANDAKRALAPFSIGPRDCVGKNLAYAEMRLILARLLWNFDIRLDPKSAGWDHRSKSYFIWERGPLNVFLTPRGSPGQL
ncbi:cytochrome p450 [Fusarium sporotrichioides]|uniref:Cytochrome p450 n=1 Tax=Fusarium sporotrichioides TaxID=5514 RepID=A0A395SNH6_FUSSP|nr:cytochrome p450 [Fusarium sporotrichioides]